MSCQHCIWTSTKITGKKILDEYNGKIYIYTIKIVISLQFDFSTMKIQFNHCPTNFFGLKSSNITNSFLIHSWHLTLKNIKQNCKNPPMKIVSILSTATLNFSLSPFTLFIETFVKYNLLSRVFISTLFKPRKWSIFLL